MGGAVPGAERRDPDDASCQVWGLTDARHVWKAVIRQTQAVAMMGEVVSCMHAATEVETENVPENLSCASTDY